MNINESLVPLRGFFDDTMNLYHNIKQALLQANTIVITSHRSPDGDSIGSSMAMYHLLKKWNKNVQVVHPDSAPVFLQWVPNQHDIIVFEQHSEKAASLLKDTELILCLDYNEESRVGEEMMQVLVQSSAKKIMIDHHTHPSDFCQLILSEVSASSTCELIYKWLTEIAETKIIDECIGTCLYLGLMTDTGSFRFPSVSSFTHQMAADLIAKGVKHYQIHEAVFDTNTIDRIKLRGYALSDKLVCLSNLPVAYISLEEQELKRFNYQKGDTEGLVNQILSVQGIEMAVLFMENDGKIKISFRSKGDTFVNEMAKKHFSGGGHVYASGGVSFDSMQQTVEKFVTLVKEYV
jgi:phosphoesterase RecJ-like protein